MAVPRFHEVGAAPGSREEVRKEVATVCCLLASRGPGMRGCASQLSRRGGEGEVFCPCACVGARQSRGIFRLQQENLWQGPEAPGGMRGDSSVPS